MKSMPQVMPVLVIATTVPATVTIAHVTATTHVPVTVITAMNN